MARAFYVNGETMVSVKGNANAGGGLIANLAQLGLSDGPIRVRPKYNHKDIQVDAWGMAPPEVQWMMGELTISMTLVHFDMPILRACMAEAACGGANVDGTFGRAGALMGNNLARFALTNHYIGLNLLSPVGGLPYRFFFAYLADTPVETPLGTEKSIMTLNWRVIPYTQDPFGDGNQGTAVGTGSAGYTLWDRNLDT